MAAGCGAATLVCLVAYLLACMVPGMMTNSAKEQQQTGRPFWQFGRPQRLRSPLQSRLSGEHTPLDPQAVAAAVQFAESSSARLSRFEHNLGAAQVRVAPGSPAHGDSQVGMPTTTEALRKHEQAQIALRASQFIADNNCRKYSLREQRCGEMVNSVSLAGTSLAASCSGQRAKNCSEIEMRYRTADGSCNNIKKPWLGQALSAYRRFVPPNYADGLQSPRGEKGSQPLPGARQASAALARDDSERRVNSVLPDTDVTLATALWAQLVTMDLAHTPVAVMTSTGQSIACCSSDGGQLPPRSRHPSCYPVAVPRELATPLGGHTCLPLVRSLTAPRPDCHFGPVEQINQVTSFLDGSFLYGSDEATARGVRKMSGGRLRLGSHAAGPLQAPAHHTRDACQGESCTLVGDSRVTEHPSLTALTRVMAREHNRVAAALAKVRPDWQEEKLFQEARRVTVAELQHLTYRHWLPLLVGKEFARQTLRGGYSGAANPSIFNSLATLPFTLSMLPEHLQLLGEARTVNKSLRLRHNFRRPEVLEKPGTLDSVIRALATQKSLPVDLLHTRDVTSGLYASSESAVGLDAVSLTIQRGRDHGLPGYVTFRVACGLPQVTTFEDLIPSMGKETVTALRSVYGGVNAVDLYVGALAELPASPGLLGPTLRCLLTKQLRDTRRADRFFYDFTDQAGSFTQAQIRELQKTSLARILCDNGDSIESMQPDVFREPGSGTNSLIPCSQIPAGPDFSSWRETQ